MARIYTYLTYDIELMENTKISRTMKQLESERSLAYLAGSSLRGAYIHNYIKNKGIKDINVAPHRKKLLGGDMYFLNAYVVKQGERALPLPKCFFASKEAMRSFSRSLDISLGFNRELPVDYQKMRLGEFTVAQGDELIEAKVLMGENTHLNTRGRSNKTYSYEYMEAGQIFRAIVRLKRELVEEFRDIFNNSYIYLGGSRGTGYGKAYVDNIIQHESNPEYPEETSFSRYLYLVALSDIVYRDRLNRYTSYFDIEALEEGLGASLEFIESSIELVQVSNFNKKWQFRSPNIRAIGKGSVFKYRLNSSLDLERLKIFIDRGLGFRKEDGFGRLGAYSNLDFKTYVRTSNFSIRPKPVYGLTTREEDIFKKILREVFYSRLKLERDRSILKLEKRFYFPSFMDYSQISDWYGFFNSLAYLESLEGKRIYKDYMGRIIGKRSSSYFKLRSIKGDESFISFLNRYMDKSDDLEDFIGENLEVFKGIEEVRDLIDREEVYRHRIQIIRDYFRFELNKRKERF